MKIKTLLGLSLGLMIVANASAAETPELFGSSDNTDVSSDKIALDTSNATFLKQTEFLKKDTSIRMMKKMDVNPQFLDPSYETIRLNMGGGIDFDIKRDDTYEMEDGSTVWAGSIQVPSFEFLDQLGMTDQIINPNQAILVRNGQRVYGEIYVNNTVYELSTTEDGSAYIMLERSKSFAIQHDDTPETVSKGYDRELLLDASQEDFEVNALAQRVIRIMQGATPQAVRAIGGQRRMRDRMNFHIAQSNQVMRNSGIGGGNGVRFVDAGKIFLTLNERINPTRTLQGLANTRDRYLDTFATRTRNNRQADLVGVITSGPGGGAANEQVCGRANQIGSNRNNGFFVVVIPSPRCDDASRPVFIHEVGHLFGSRHDNDTTRTPFPYGHGFSSSRARSVMAFDVAFGANVVLFLSNPSRRVNGVNLGISGFSNNQRVFNEQAGRISRYR